MTNGHAGGAAEESLLYELLNLGFALADRTNELIADVLRELEFDTTSTQMVPTLTLVAVQ